MPPPPTQLGLGLGLVRSGGVGGRFPISTIAALGDSLSSGVAWSAEPRTESSYLWPLLSHTKRSIELVRDPATGRNFQTGGFTAAQIRDTHLPSVIAAAPDACVVLAGANDLAEATGTFRPNLEAAAESIWATIAEIVTALKGAGIVPIVGTIIPDVAETASSWPATGNQYHPDTRQTRKLLNDLIRAHATALGARVVDWAPLLSSDPADDAAIGDIGYYTDHIHPYRAGEWRMGDALIDLIDRKFKTVGSEFVIPGADSPLWVTANPYMTGNVSGLATGWNITTSGSPAPTVVRSKTADGWQRLSCADGTDPGINRAYSFERFAQVTDNSFDGKFYRGVVEFYPLESDWEYWLCAAVVTATRVDTVVTSRVSRAPDLVGSAEIGNLGKIWTYRNRYFFVTPPVQHPGGAGADRRRLTFQLSMRGRGTVDIRVAGIFEVPTP